MLGLGSGTEILPMAYEETRREVNRRAFVTGLGAVLAAPRVAGAQQAGKVYRIGMLGPARGEQAGPYFAAFRQRMREHGWSEGTDFVLEIRLAEGRIELFPDLASDLVRSDVAVIVAWSTPAVIAAKRA